MAADKREPEAVAPGATDVEQLRRELEERRRRADERDRIADERERSRISASGSQTSARRSRTHASGLPMNAPGSSKQQGPLGALPCGEARRRSGTHTKRSTGRGTESTATRPDWIAKEHVGSERRPRSSARSPAANAKTPTPSNRAVRDADETAGVMPAAPETAPCDREPTASARPPSLSRTSCLEVAEAGSAAPPGDEQSLLPCVHN